MFAEAVPGYEVRGGALGSTVGPGDFPGGGQGTKPPEAHEL